MDGIVRSFDIYDENKATKRRYPSGTSAKDVNLDLDGGHYDPKRYRPNAAAEVIWYKNFFAQFDPFQDFRGKPGREVAWKVSTLFVPALKWMRTYDKGNLKYDVLAGLTVGVMIVPQGMAYALIAGLEPVYGLYASLVPVFMYSLFGTSRQIAIGPVALVSLLTHSALHKYDADTPELYARYAFTLSFMVGIFQIVLGVLRLGFIVNLLSHAVISGFTSAAAVLIGLSQLRYMLGFKIPSTETLIDTVDGLVHGIGKFHWQTFVMSMAWFGTLLTFKHLARKHKRLAFLKAIGPITVCVVATVVMFLGKFHEDGIWIVGYVPEGLPKVGSDFVWGSVNDMLPKALIISFVGFVESISIGKALANKNRYELDTNMELFGVGIANFVGSFCQSYSVTGSFSRSAVNNDTGAKTGLAGMVTALVVLLTLVVLTPLIEFLPKNALAAVVMNSVTGLIDIPEFLFLLRTHRRDLICWSCSFLGTLLLGVEIGILIAVAVSLVFVIYATARPHTALLGLLPGTYVYRSVLQYPEATVEPGIPIIRIDAPLYFANVSFVKEKIKEYEQLTQKDSDGQPIRFVILDMGPVLSVDSTGIHALKQMLVDYDDRGVKLCISNPNADVVGTLDRAGVIDTIGREWMFFRVHEAVAACRQAMDIESANGACSNGGAAEGTPSKGPNKPPRPPGGNGVRSRTNTQ